MSDDTSAGTAHAFHCFGGGEAPPAIVQGFEALLALPESVIRQLWPLLEATLQTSDSSGNPELTRWFADQHGADPSVVVAGVRCCDYVLRQAAALDLPREKVQSDLEALCGGSAALIQMIMPHYSSVFLELRNRILEDTLADHGKVLVGLDWRLDRLRASHRGTALETDVVFLRLSYRDGDETKPLSLQLTPGGVQALRELCEQLSE